MEALTPPPTLERAVLALIPPAAREAVAGDLCETYRSPRQYLREALRTVPFVIASQARRNLNLPVLMLQAALADWLLGPWAAALLVPVLILCEAWRPAGRPAAARAIRETMAIALLAMVFVQGLSFDNGVMRQMGLGHAAWTSLYFFGFLVAPLLCALRTGMIVSGDRTVSAPGVQTLAELTRDYDAFARQSRRRNHREAGALAVAAALLAMLGALPLLVLLFALAAAWLAVPGLVPKLTGDTDFPGLRARFKQELDRQQQQRRFLWWLWFAPPLVALHDRVMRHAHPIAGMLAMAAMLLLCFLVTALNREQSGRAQEDIGALDRLREAAAG